METARKRVENREAWREWAQKDLPKGRIFMIMMMKTNYIKCYDKTENVFIYDLFNIVRD